MHVDGKGAEDLTLGPDGYLYTGLEDGRIIRFLPGRPDESTTYVNTGGRPLGLEFASDGYLVVADAELELLAVDRDRFVHTMTDTVDDLPLVFVNHLDIATDETVWFSDSSRRFSGDAWLNMMEGSATGRLRSYDPKTGKTTTHLDGLRFANGVALGPDDAFVLVCETLAAKIIRFWIKGPRAGSSDTFAEGLPGYPDNIAHADTGSFWVALPAARSKSLEYLASRPLLRAILMRLPWLPSPSIPPVSRVLRLDANGNVLHRFRHRVSEHASVTSAMEIDGALYLGTIDRDAIARVAVSPSGVRCIPGRTR